MHHLRFDSEAAKRQVAATSALRVEGLIRHPPLEESWEYFVVVAVRNDPGEEIARQVVNVGALQGTEKRTFTLSVEMLPPHAPSDPNVKTNTGTTSTNPVVQPANLPQGPGKQTPAQLAGLKPPVPGQKPPSAPGKKH